MECRMKVLLEKATCRYDEALHLTKTKTKEWFKCIMYHPNVTPYVLTSVSLNILFLNDFEDFEDFTNLNCFFIIILDYYEYLKSTYCRYGCLYQNRDIHCQNKGCKRTNVYKFIKCRIKLDPLYKNVRYRQQIDCLYDKYTKYYQKRMSEVCNKIRLDIRKI